MIIRRQLLVLLLAVCASLGGGPIGCRPKRSPSSVDALQLAAYGELPGLRASHHPLLRAELARLLADQATPRQLMRRGSPGAEQGDAASEAIPAATPYADSEMGDVFPPHVLTSAGSRAVELLTAWQGRDAAEAVPDLQPFLELHDPSRQWFRTKLVEPGFRLPTRHVEGLMADLSFVDATLLAARLEALRAATQLQENQLGEAVESLAYMLRAARLLDGEKLLATRMAAASLRGESLSVLQAMVLHPAATKQTYEQLQGLLAAQLVDWPGDADAWIGERAEGLHTYELVRDGHLLSLLTEEELRELAGSEGSRALAMTAVANVDDDELFYLQTMRAMIEACGQPYYQRLAVLRRQQRELNALRGGPKFPFVAAQILLTNVELGHRRQAEDRALCEAWLLALASALGKDEPTPQVNPLTGEAYRVARRETQVEVVEVRGKQDDPPLVVPLR